MSPSPAGNVFPSGSVTVQNGNSVFVLRWVSQVTALSQQREVIETVRLLSSSAVSQTSTGVHKKNKHKASCDISPGEDETIINPTGGSRSKKLQELKGSKINKTYHNLKWSEIKCLKKCSVRGETGVCCHLICTGLSPVGARETQQRAKTDMHK